MVGNVFMTMSRHDLGRQAVVLLDKIIRSPKCCPNDTEFLHMQAGKLLDAWRVKNRSTLNETEGA